MRVKRLKIKLALLALMALAVFVWLESKSLSSSVLGLFLRQAGFQEASSDGFWPGLRSTTLYNFQFSYSALNGRAQSLTLDYSPTSLKSGTIDAIKIEKGEFNVKAVEDRIGLNSESKKVSDWKLNEVADRLKALPFSSLSIDDVRLNYFDHLLLLDNFEFVNAPQIYSEIRAEFPQQSKHQIKLNFKDKNEFAFNSSSELGAARIGCRLQAIINAANSLALKNESDCNVAIDSENYLVEFLNTSVSNLDSSAIKLGTNLRLSGPESLHAQVGLSLDFEPSKQALKVSLDRGEISQGALVMKGADLQTVLALTNSLSTQEAVKIRIESLLFGLPIEDLSLKFDYSPVRLKHLSGSAKVADGLLKVLSSDVNLTQPGWKLSFVAAGLSLKQILAAYPQQAVEAQGILDLNFDLIKVANGFEIHSGRIKATEPGVIKVMNKSFAESHPELSVVMDQLSNFHFDKLEGDINLDVAGNMILNLSIRGKNPELKSARVIDLNLKLEDNLFDLAKTIKLINAKN